MEFLGDSTEEADDHDDISPKNIDENEKKEAPPPWDDFIMQDFEIILRDEYGTVKVDNDGNPITMNCRPPTDLVGRVFLTKPDPRGNRHRASIIERQRI